MIKNGTFIMPLFILLLTSPKAHSQNDLLNIINSSKDEYGIAFLTDNLVCFTRDEDRKKLMLTEKEHGVWKEPYIAPFSGVWRDEYPSFDKNTSRLYFSSQRPIEQGQLQRSKNDIWYVEYNNGAFGNPIHLGGRFSTDGIDSGAYGVNNKVYFHSDRAGRGMNSVDIYEGYPDGSKEVKLPFNSDKVDGEPFLFNDGNSMLFMSAGHGTIGNSDIFITNKMDGIWSKPVPVDNEGLVNTKEWEYTPSLSPDSRTLYFTRITNGQSDIMSVPVNRLSSSEWVSKTDIGQTNAELADKVDKLILPLVETNNYSGSVLLSRNGKTLFNKGYGLSDVGNEVPINNKSKFFLASASMPFTAVAIMKLVDQGKIALNDNIDKYIPEYKHGSKIKVHHLLAQRSGIPAIGAESNVDYDTMSLSKQTIESLYNYFKDYKLLFEPDSKYNHGRSDYILLAMIIEKLSGKNFGAYLKETIFDPLKMKSTGHFSGYETIIPNLVKGYGPVGLYEVENAFPIDWSAKTGHASIYTTTEDLQKFGQAIIDGKILSESSWKAIFTDYGNSVGYGWFVRDHGSHKRVQMNGRSPGFSSYFAVYPQDNVVIAMLSNNYISLPADMGIPLASILFDEPYQPLLLSTDKLSKEDAIEYEGTYQFDKNFYRPNFQMTISFKEGHLFSDWGGLIPINPKENGFKKFILRTYWLNVLFETDDFGKISGIKVDNQHLGKKI